MYDFIQNNYAIVAAQGGKAKRTNKENRDGSPVITTTGSGKAGANLPHRQASSVPRKRYAGALRVAKTTLKPLSLGAAAPLFCVLGSLLFSLPLAAQRGALTIQQNLAELVGEAAAIVRGHVVSARVEPHPDFQNLQTVVVTLKVEEVLKGEAVKDFTFRQYIWDIRDRYDAAGYRKGQHLLLLMTEPSRYGLSSPVGLEQGRFRVLRGPQGQQSVVNGRSNAGLFQGMMPHLQKQRVRLEPRLARLVEEHRAGPLPLNDFEALIHTLAGTSPEKQ